MTAYFGMCAAALAVGIMAQPAAAARGSGSVIERSAAMDFMAAVPDHIGGNVTQSPTRVRRSLLDSPYANVQGTVSPLLDGSAAAAEGRKSALGAEFSPECQVEKIAADPRSGCF